MRLFNPRSTDDSIPSEKRSVSTPHRVPFGFNRKHMARRGAAMFNESDFIMFNFTKEGDENQKRNVVGPLDFKIEEDDPQLSDLAFSS